MILAWDAPTPAVLVEARIVEVTSGFGSSSASSGTLNGVKDAGARQRHALRLPELGERRRHTRRRADVPSNYMVNLPAAAATGGIGFSLRAHREHAQPRPAALAMETMGKIKILSNPKVLVVQNQKAVINLGSQLPVTKTDTEGNRTVEWKDVGIMLEVTPQVTNDKRVFMDIKVEKSSQGDNVQTTEGTMFSINTSRAETKVLIADGETTVIGGIFVEETSNERQTAIPGFSKIPVLGWLFKSKTDTAEKTRADDLHDPALVVM